MLDVGRSIDAWERWGYDDDPPEDFFALMSGFMRTVPARAEEIDPGTRVAEVVAMSLIAPSRAEAKRLIASGAVTINNKRTTDLGTIITTCDFAFGEWLMVGKGSSHRSLLRLASGGSHGS